MRTKKTAYVDISDRLRWIEDRLYAGSKINCTIIANEFGLSIKTAQRSINLLRRYYGLKIEYDPDTRSFFLA